MPTAPRVITATALDTETQAASSSAVNVIVDNTAPVIAISGPAGGSTESDTITVTASANDATSDVIQVEFFANSNSIGVDTNASDGWSVPWDTTNVTNGTYDLTAQATDTAENSSTATAVQITVDNIGELQQVTYFSVQNETAVGGLSVADEDVIAFNGTDFSLLFDGSDVGLGSFDINALSVISETEILMSFTNAGTIGGLAMDDSDIVLFTASSLGTTTAGTFEMYLDGSDVGLSSSREDIDGFQLLSNGNLLISTEGSFRGTGASGADEDIFEFTPTNLGNTTAGSFSIYFDGSDVGLGGSRRQRGSNRDIDGFAILNEQLYFTTVGTLSVTGTAGEDEDIFVFNPTSLGSATSGSFDSALFFDGSFFGIGGYRCECHRSFRQCGRRRSTVRTCGLLGL